MRTPAILALALVVGGCADRQTRRLPRRVDASGGSGLSTSTVTGLGTTGGTGSGTPTTTATFDCTQDLPGAPLPITSYGIQTQEDFDFSLGGYLIYQEDLGVIGTDKQANQTVLSPGTAGDPRGVHGLADGRIVIMSPWDGSIKIANPYSAGVQVIASSLNTPNGVDVGSNDRIYFTSYGEVGWLEVDGSNHQVIHQWSGAVTSPNGTVLSPDEQQLVVAAPTLSTTEFWTFERLGPDQWGNAQVLFTANGFFSALDMDVCGNLYTVEYNTGEVFRIDPSGTAEAIAHLTGAGFWGFSALRFGPGHSGWDRDHLYVSKRNTEVFDIDVGVPGRAHPTTPATGSTP